MGSDASRQSPRAEVSANAKTGPERGLFGALVDASGLSVGVATFLICIFVAYDVLTRSLLRMSNSWVTELTMYLMAFVAFVGAAYALREGAHVSVDMLVQRVSSVAARRLRLIADTVMVLVVTTLTWLSFRFFLDAWTSNEMSDTLMSVHLWKPFLSFFVGMLWLLVVLAEQLVRSRRSRLREPL